MAAAATAAAATPIVSARTIALLRTWLGDVIPAVTGSFRGGRATERKCPEALVAAKTFCFDAPTTAQDERYVMRHA